MKPIHGHKPGKLFLKLTILYRTFGQHYLYYHAPNKKERLEMIWRSMGKAYDWELEKFRVRFLNSLNVILALKKIP